MGFVQVPCSWKFGSRMMVWWLLCVFMIMAGLMSCDGTVRLSPNMTAAGIFAFGDSIVDQGNNNVMRTIVKCNFPPYGKDFQGGVPTGRFSNGRTPPDFVAEALGIATMIPAYLDPSLTIKDFTKGVSFASGGCGYDPQTAQLVSVTSLTDQLEQFKDYVWKLKGAVGEEAANNILNSSIHLVVAGSDDLANTYFTIGIRRRQYDVTSYADLVVSSASTFIQQLYLVGARKIAVFGVPPIGCLPAQRTLAGGSTRACVEEYNKAAQIVNAKLAPALDSLTQSLPQSRVVYIDVYNPLLDLIQHPQKYGFEVSDIGCCGTGKIEAVVLCNQYSGTCADDSKYIFWDSYHPTEKAYKFLVDQIVQKYANKFL
ncbi:GDSL esterase/lipase EXL3-like [Andrographis paniculata]|uniref:GDSL esterase/lipase EXL3-like n=1 Tax=Andrographis paniculata TaxID=175694 RepID=UPI0021E798D9|nr:GDSL esterase/lipase EXL3-like [Andrographis paniculata]